LTSVEVLDYTGQHLIRRGGTMPLKWRAVLVGIVFLTLPTYAQQPSTPSSPVAPVRDAQALTVLQSAIAAMGGANAAAAIQDFTVQGTEQYVIDPDPTPAIFTWQTSGVEFSYTVQNANGTYTALSGHGIPAQLKHGNWIPLPPYVSRAELAFHNPAFVLYTELLNPNYTFQYIGSGVVNGNPAIHLHAADNSDSTGQLVTPQEWYFDPTSYLPVRVEFKVPGQRSAQGFTAGSIDFANYQSINSISVPYQLLLQVGHVTITVASIGINTGLTASTFDPPTGSAQ
jgi:hypothetical protein